MTRVLAVAAFALTLGGCISLLPEAEPVDTYRLAPVETPALGAARPVGAPTLMVGIPSATRAYGGDRIVVVRDDGSLALAAGVRWAAPVRSMLQNAVIETFEGAPGPAPLRPGDGVAANYDLSLDLRRFEAEYDNGMEAAPRVRVAVGARVIARSRELSGASGFSADVRARSNTMTDIVAAFSEASKQVADSLVAWSAAVVEEAEARRAAEEEARS